MPYEVSMSGGSPWGFRLSGGVVSGTPVSVSRVTPGGKAAQANVMQGDVLVALNTTSVSDMDLPEIMEQIKISGWTLHLTLLSQEEVEHSAKNKRKSEANFTSVTQLERPRSQLAMTPCSERPSSKLSFHNGDDANVSVKSHEVCDDISQRSASPLVPPKPKPRKTTQPVDADMEQTEICDESVPKKKVPDFIRRQIKPTKALPSEFKPQVSWLHDKLRLKLKHGSGITDPGNSLKAAAAAYPCQPIEIEGPVSATIVHAQYNTPVGMYSANQIVNTLVSTAAAKGAEVPDAGVFGDQNVPVDTNTPTYRLIHKTERSTPVPVQSKSIQILDALLDYENGDLQL
uniref:PDZ domain-containing protein n=1 Tax=Ciona savignyi TaxID=51511 RepID=H2ZFU4_CIOSA